ncbi:CrcB family protein [Microbacterium terregens]|uniref:Fluoride-specific ion channel FluC n=1 Tax=Microbacterium terregens TaxID=69363 RepID=A0ABV5SZY4_9MICO
MPRRPVPDVRMLGAVFLGGVIGVAARELLLLPFSDRSSTLALTFGTMVVNVVGSFALGLVVGSLADRHPTARVFLGTGVLGGFTTYSAFAVQTATLLSAAPVAGIALAAASVILGLAAAGLGLRLTLRPRGETGGPSDEPEGAR